MKVLHIRMPEERLEIIDQIMEGKNITEKARNFMNSEYIDFAIMEFEIKKCEARLKLLKETFKKNIFHDIKNLPKEEEGFLNLATNILNKNPEFILGQKNLYNKNFNKNISIKEFKLLLYELKNGTKEDN